MNKIRTRYAPSPTGYFHIGGARTALFNYLFAKHHKGDFIVRIEDTDVERNVENGIESQLLNLEWLSIIPDESVLRQGSFGPYKQSEKFDRYADLAHKLVKQNKAYYCFCTKEELDQQRQDCDNNHTTPKYNRKCLYLSPQEIQAKLDAKIPYVIRLKIQDNTNYEWDDLIRGKISIPSSAMTDPVILKSNGIAMYNFAVVIDDYDMQITHILRGEEHISNTPYQIAIKQALGFDSQLIHYGHLSIITNKEGKKLSKRDSQLKQFIEDYKNLGYLPSGIVNFLALLGWSPANNKEIMQMNELIEQFDIKNLSKSPAMFDEEKLKWVSSQHFKLCDEQTYLSFVSNFVKSQNKVYLSHQKDVLLLFKNQISCASEIDSLIDEYFGDKNEYDMQVINDFKSELKLIYPLLLDKIKIIDFNASNIKLMINEIQVETNLKAKSLYMPIRILASHKVHGPDLTTLLFLLGKDKLISNIEEIIQYVK